MYRVVVFIVLVAAVLADDDMKKCRRLLHGDGFRCCSKSPLEKLDFSHDDIKECLDVPVKPHSCELEECIAKKKGYYTSSGGLDMDALAASVENDFKNSPELTAAVKENCVKDISQYGPPDMCDFKKLKLCLDVQILKLCDEWNNEGNCSGTKELFEECTKRFT